MIKRFILSSLFASGLVLLVGIPFVGAQEQEKDPYVCEGPYKGQKLSQEQLESIVKAHEKWMISLKKEGEQANLCEAYLWGAKLQGATLAMAQLQGAILIEAQLQRADLRGAQLQRADLGGAQLQGAILVWAQLQRADLGGAQLQKAYMAGAQLQGAILDRAQLQGANLARAQLQGASLNGAQLQGADLAIADVQDVWFELKPDSLPSIPSLATTKNLSTMTYTNSPHALVELREAFKQKGMRDQEREVTYAIERTKREKSWSEGSALDQIEAGFKYIMFEITSDYGMTPGRPLRILIVYTLGLSFLYGWVFRRPLENAKIFAVASQPVFEDYKALEDNLSPEKIAHEKKIPINYKFFYIKQWRTGGGNLKTLILTVLSCATGGFYFSLLSTFRLGWRDLNVGTWITRIQPRDYTLQATGWVKVVSGMQSLISVYLIALWALTYFGRPFE